MLYTRSLASNVVIDMLSVQSPMSNVFIDMLYTPSFVSNGADVTNIASGLKAL